MPLNAGSTDLSIYIKLERLYWYAEKVEEMLETKKNIEEPFPTYVSYLCKSINIRLDELTEMAISGTATQPTTIGQIINLVLIQQKLDKLDKVTNVIEDTFTCLIAPRGRLIWLVKTEIPYRIRELRCIVAIKKFLIEEDELAKINSFKICIAKVDLIKATKRFVDPIRDGSNLSLLLKEIKPLKYELIRVQNNQDRKREIANIEKTFNRTNSGY